MMDLGQVKDVVGVSRLSHDRQAGDFAAGIELQPEGLQDTRLNTPVHEPDGEGDQPVHAGPSPLQEQARPLLAAGHQGML
jgi:hypothetical protein